MGGNPALPKLRAMLGEMLQAFNPSIQKAEAGGPCEFKPSPATEAEQNRSLAEQNVDRVYWRGPQRAGSKSKGERMKTR